VIEMVKVAVIYYRSTANLHKRARAVEEGASVVAADVSEEGLRRAGEVEKASPPSERTCRPQRT
jgi:hypothetical protein